MIAEVDDAITRRALAEAEATAQACREEAAVCLVEAERWQHKAQVAQEMADNYRKALR